MRIVAPCVELRPLQTQPLLGLGTWSLSSPCISYIYFSSVVVFAKAPPMQFPPVKSLLVRENDDEKRSESEG